MEKPHLFCDCVGDSRAEHVVKDFSRDHVRTNRLGFTLVQATLLQGCWSFARSYSLDHGARCRVVWGAGFVYR